MILRWLKRNGILIAALIGYVALLVGGVFEIDSRWYQTRKRAIINRNHPGVVFDGEIDDFLGAFTGWRQATQILRASQSAGPREATRLNDARDVARAKMIDRAREVLDGPTSIYRIEIKEADGATVFDDVNHAKVGRFDDFSNSLWVRPFRMRVGEAFDGGAGRPEILGQYDLNFTTPDTLPAASVAEIAEVTTWYRWLTVALALGLTFFMLLFVRLAILPVRSVTDSIADSILERTRFIARPRSELESLYNGMARDAVLARLQRRINARVERGEVVTGWSLIEAACDELIDQLPRAWVACVELAPDVSGRLRPTDRRLMRRGPRAAGSETEESFIGEAARRAENRGADFADPAAEGVAYALAFAADRPVDREWIGEFRDRFAGVVEQALGALSGRRRALERERGRASINLSRNLGHDLTNVLARSKLELATLDSLLGNGPPPDSEERRETLRQSLRGLIDSTRFLQEIVNLYRAYEFLHEPALEKRDVNAVVGEAAGLFRMATSERLRLTERLDPAAPPCSLDPRLFKLALFNLFTNSVEAIRRAGRGREGEGAIELATARSPEGGLILTVHDNGAGILNEAGAPAAPQEIERIFVLGYSMREDLQGEGLGLNWVRTIVRDIHGGSIRAENAPGGGALFTLTFPPAS
jgi:signal transduction histidine kinase